MPAAYIELVFGSLKDLDDSAGLILIPEDTCTRRHAQPEWQEECPCASRLTCMRWYRAGLEHRTWQPWREMRSAGGCVCVLAVHCAARTAVVSNFIAA
eukprot:1506277-Pleurochrysis_carterae.AAC.1